MGNNYTAKDILDEFSSNRPYQKKCINYNGKTDEGEYYIELIAKSILEKNNFDIVPYLSDRDNFIFEDRKLNTEPGTEKTLCRRWYRQKNFEDDLFESLGRPFQCELNIVKNTKVNVDLVSYYGCDGEDVLYLIEVKGTKNKNQKIYSTDETLLRCVLEIQTYWTSLIQKKIMEILLRDLKIEEPRISEKTIIKKAILVPEGSKAAGQLNKSKFPYTNKLIDKWDIKVVVYKNNIK